MSETALPFHNDTSLTNSEDANSLKTNRNDFYTLAVESKLVPHLQWMLKTLGQATNFREMNRSKPVCWGLLSMMITKHPCYAVL